MIALINSKWKNIDVSRVSLNRETLQNLPLFKQDHESRLRNFRPMSPVKLFTTFLGGSPIKQRNEQVVLNSIPLLAPQLSPNLEVDRAQVVQQNKPTTKVSVVGVSTTDSKDTLTLLQDTLATYLVSLHTKSGNMVGRVLRGRAGADELLVNDLYNVLGLSPYWCSLCNIG